MSKFIQVKHILTSKTTEDLTINVNYIMKVVEASEDTSEIYLSDGSKFYVDMRYRELTRKLIVLN